MERYDFEIVTDKHSVTVARDITVDNPRDLWLRIAAIARSVRAQGSIIRVRHGAGIVVLVGAASALQLCADLLNNLPQM
jgi:hypothetical protein